MLEKVRSLYPVSLSSLFQVPVHPSIRRIKTFHKSIWNQPILISQLSLSIPEYDFVSSASCNRFFPVLVIVNSWLVNCWGVSDILSGVHTSIGGCRTSRYTPIQVHLIVLITRSIRMVLGIIFCETIIATVESVVLGQTAI